MGRRKTFKVEVSATFYEKLKEVASKLGMSVDDYVDDLVSMSN